ncbi:MAG: hypothetical protein IPO92_00700 [Saprospiraceae bacterium]|nr:hypothetical protein [Saprospiraceae bacterium]
MQFSKVILISLIGLCLCHNDLMAKEPVTNGKAPIPDVTGWRAACVRPTKQVDMQVNNVRARLLTGGDIWSEAAYIVPKPAPGTLPVSALFAGGVWIGGVDRSGNIKLSGVTYRSLGFDFFAGPLDISGTTEQQQCQDWDRFFSVKGADVVKHFNNLIRSIETGVPIVCDSVPDDVRYWPGQGNPYWREKYNFSLPDQTLGAFWDQDGDNIYDPCFGDFPLIDIRGCEPDNLKEAKELIPDEMVFWIYNDNGGPQTLSGVNKIQMEVQVQSFAYATNDEINDMTFYRYKLINKASEDIIDCYFSMWIDPDLGCYADDYIGCDVQRSLAYVYNQDAVDGTSGTACNGVNTYGTTVPILGMDYFRGPLGPKVFKRDPITNIPILRPVIDENGDTVKVNGVVKLVKVLLEPEKNSGQQDTLVELGMTSFTYSENGGIGSPPPATQDPQRGREDGFYNYIRGFWSDGTPFTFGGTGYNPGSTDSIRYAFPGEPNLSSGWSMCSVGMPFGDRRTLQATGPLLLQPGATNELILGVVFVPDITYPCPDITRLKFADDIAQALFDNCFDITDGPDAPDITAIELDRELILMLSNESTSNNFNESYDEVDLQAPMVEDNKYKFEGYRIYQLVNATVTGQELDDISKARPIAQVDLKNGIREIYNWTGEVNPLDPIFGPPVWTPTRQVSGEDKGIRTTFRITEDQFAIGADRKLVNHKQYHFLSLAYAHNNWKPFDLLTSLGQKRAYLEGRGNVGGPEKKAYTLVPRPIVYENLQTLYGVGPLVTRIAGEGNPGKFLDMDETMYELILNKSNGGKVLYKSGAGPIDAKVVDPLRMKDGKYRLEITGGFNYARATCAFDNGAVWKLTNVSDESNPKVLLQNRSLAFVKEYIINNFGFSITVSNADDPGTEKKGNNGAIGARLEYKDPAGTKWFNGIQDGGIVQSNATGNVSFNFVDFVRNSFKEDVSASLSKMGDGFFVPFLSTRFEDDIDLPLYLSPSAREFMALMTNSTNNSIRYRDLNNVDIVFTSDKTKWSKCIVVETASPDYIEAGFATIGNSKNFEVRQSPSIDADGKVIGGNGFSYFPGYAVDVETGKRLNIFFGENSVYSGDEITEFLDGKNPIGGDMIYNPSPQLFLENAGNVSGLVMGGQHYIYVTRQEYDGCASLETKLKKGASTLNKAKGGPAVTWVAFPLGVTGAPMLPLEKGLIPNELIVKLRVNNPYGESRKYNIEKERDCETDGDQPVYEFEFRNTQPDTVKTKEEYVGALANVNVVPNPYYAYSAYETSQFTNTIKITNLPAKAIVTIYSIDGSFIKRYNRDERGLILSGSNRPTSTTQVFPDLDWDMKNFKDIPVASGVYLIHISAPEYGEERTIKWFGIGRKFDPSGL